MIQCFVTRRPSIGAWRLKCPQTSKIAECKSYLWVPHQLSGFPPFVAQLIELWFSSGGGGEKLQEEFLQFVNKTTHSAILYGQDLLLLINIKEASLSPEKPSSYVTNCLLWVI